MGGGWRCFNLISNLGVESAMADFEAESIFLTLFQGHLYYNISTTPNIRHPVIGGGGGHSFDIIKLFILFFLFLMKSHK